MGLLKTMMESHFYQKKDYFGVDFSRYGAPVFATLILLGWALGAWHWDYAQFGDNVEQYIWSQSPQWGYHKHPPLPTWLLMGVTQIFGASLGWAPALSTLCFAITLWLTWQIAKQLANEKVAAVTVLLWGLLQYFSSRSQLYNHNTVMVLCITLTAWCALNIDKSWLWWIGAGIASAAAMMAKYQSIVLLVSILLALVFTGRLRVRVHQWGMALAVAIGVLLFLPHLQWMAQNDFITLRYGLQSAQPASLGERLGFALSFVVNQLRVALPLCLGLVAYALWMRFSPIAPAASTTALAQEQKPLTLDTHARVWIVALCIGPLVFMLLLALVFGVHLRNHWGMQVLQFAPLAIAYGLCQRGSVHIMRLAVVVLVMQVLSMGWYARSQQDALAMSYERRIDTLYPAQKMADVGLSEWSKVTQCPLHIVAGDFEAGLVALYGGRTLGKFPTVFTNASATPWIRDDDLVRNGALWVLPEGQALPAGLTVATILDLGHPDTRYIKSRSVTIAVQLPQISCDLSFTAMNSIHP